MIHHVNTRIVVAANIRIVRANHSDIFLVRTGCDAPSSVRAVNQGGFVSIAIHSIQPHAAVSWSKTLENLSHTCKTKFVAHNAGVFYSPSVVTNCAPFSLMKHLDAAFPFGAAAYKSNVSLGCSLYRTDNSSISIVAISHTPVMHTVPQSILIPFALHVFQGTLDISRRFACDCISTGVSKLPTCYKCIMDIPAVITDGFP